ncbi:MAG TPA: DUF3352 domain-containing protein [Nocardioides sp.]|jgi:hypothetical protein|uniref:DUF3352 domain-containing protein n=1 Tax=Nocardioides sp. TaxID=35761 RepID=UPI002E32C4DB|nr:DUF3352 domain-containing protein [Nocardioides sp.]HEX3930625.1 DUF3352 domain-containing protein [Nocardioides sp.]
MSEHQPPPGTPEYLEQGTGTPLSHPSAPDGVAPPTRGRRRGLWVAGGVVVLLGAGAGAWAALSFFRQGAQPAEALPANTVAYISLDLDPAGGQKLDAFRTLDKFPAFKHEVGVSSVADLRHKIGYQLVTDAGCSGLDYSRDIDPWLGDRMAAAAVPLGGDRPHVVVVVQVTDEDQARAGIAKLEKCSGAEHHLGVVVKDGWATLAESQEVADEVSTDADKADLADDATYQKWTKAVGEAGVVNAYASPDIGTVLGKELGSVLGGGMFGPGGESFAESESGTVQSSAFHATPQSAGDPFSQALSTFRGGAATVRFTGDGLELAAAGDASSPQLAQLTGRTGGQLVAGLPDDTAAALSTSFTPGWLEKELDSATGRLGEGMSKDDIERELSQATGLTIPDDIETLLGKGVVVSVGKDLDVKAAEGTDDGAGVPVAATVKGDATAIEQVLGKIRAKVGDTPLLGSSSSGDLISVGPSEAYRQHVLAGGDLGGDGTFSDVVPDAANANAVLYVNVDALQATIDKASSGDDPEGLANLTPLRALGISSWLDDGVARFSLKVSTD